MTKITGHPGHGTSTGKSKRSVNVLQGEHAEEKKSSNEKHGGVSCADRLQGGLNKQAVQGVNHRYRQVGGVQTEAHLKKGHSRSTGAGQQ